MNIVKELRRKKGVQQKELAIEIGVSQPTVSEWEAGKKDPSGERLKKLAAYFEVDELVILGRGLQDTRDEQQETVNRYETEQIVRHVIEQLGGSQKAPITQEAQILAHGIDRLPKEKREQALAVVKAMFSQYADYFQKGDDE